MLSREVAGSMRGRAMEAPVFPFSFREFLRHHGREPQDPERVTKAQWSAVRKDLETYLTLGGFPEAQGVPDRDRTELLRGYVDVTLLRDVIERYGVSQPLALRQLTRHLLASAAGLSSRRRRSKRRCASSSCGAEPRSPMSVPGKVTRSISSPGGRAETPS